MIKRNLIIGSRLDEKEYNKKEKKEILVGYVKDQVENWWNWIKFL